MDDDLDGVLQRAFQALREGAGTHGSAWRNLALATAGAGGKPRIRTLVLRAFAPARADGGPTVDLHTDSRSAKVAELAASAHASLHGWNAGTGEQVRIEGTIVAHTGDDTTRTAWAALHPKTRDTYRVEPGPGTPIADPSAARAALGDGAAFAMFTVLRLHVASLEYLLIAPGGHRRALFTWARGVHEAMWLVP